MKSCTQHDSVVYQSAALNQVIFFSLHFLNAAGQLSQCLQNGDWILLDEINLASPDTLECLSSVLESESGSIVLMERGDARPITRNAGFR